MSDKNKKYILTNGENYIEIIKKKYFGGPKKRPHQYEEAKIRLCNNLSDIEEKISEKKEIFLEKKVICVRLEPEFEAKSYAPTSLKINKRIEIIGGRRYNLPEKDKYGKLYFFRTDLKGISDLKNILSTDRNDEVKSWRDTITSINRIDLLEESEKVLGFDRKWEKGRVEVVLHPLGDSYETINKFIELSKLQLEDIKCKSYEDGITFISLNGNKEILQRISKFNPLRTVHPIGDINYLDVEREIEGDAPEVPLFKGIPKVKVGVFDGGVDEDNPLLKGYVKNYEMVNTPRRALSHGTGVCGSILYGDIRGKKTLSSPNLFVESFRVLPLTENDNKEEMYEMYETIDIIENTVKNRQDVKLFNISLGPRGMILDDTISRFTYVLDKLTYDEGINGVNPLFCIAVGNDGRLQEPLNRVQAPADMVNGLAVGAYTQNHCNEPVVTDYSCCGPGREGCKVKPDILEFGGDDVNPFIKIGTNFGKIAYAKGTSFATPLATKKIGEMMVQSSDITPHLGRTLLIHSADKKGEEQIKVGNGFSLQEADSILECSDKRVTITYEGNFSNKSFVKLPIFLTESSGDVKITWTVCAISKLNLMDTDSYTSNCILDSFVPNTNKYKYTYTYEDEFGKEKHKTKSVDCKKNPEKEEELLEKGYKKSENPIPKSIPVKEDDLRSKELKWDTVIKKEVTVRSSSLNEPYITLESISRNDEDENIKYFVAVTIEAPKYKGSLYDTIIQKYTNLVPINIEIEEESRVNLTNNSL